MLLKVLFYNVQFVLPGYTDHKRAQKIRSFLLSQECDIIGICEAYLPTLRKILVDDQELHQQFPYRLINIGGEGKKWIHSGLVLLSKYPIIGYSRIEFKHQLHEPIIGANMRTNRDLIFAKIGHPQGEIGVFLTHLQFGHSQVKTAMRSLQIQELPWIIRRFWSTDQPTLFMGDLNVKPNHPQFMLLQRTMYPLLDWWPTLFPNQPGTTFAQGNTRQIFLPDTRFDYFFSTSDLLPTVMEIPQPRWNTETGQWQPTTRFSLLTRILIQFSRLFRLIDVPKAIILEVQRKIQGLPPRIKVIHDLSDHYPIVGITQIRRQQPIAIPQNKSKRQKITSKEKYDRIKAYITHQT